MTPFEIKRKLPDPRFDLARYKAVVRQIACAKYPTNTLSSCERCGKPPGHIPRHHPDIVNRPGWIVILCDDCHIAADRELSKNWCEKYSDIDSHCVPSSAPMVHVIGMPGAGKSSLLGKAQALTKHCNIIGIDRLIDLSVSFSHWFKWALSEQNPIIVETSGLNKDADRLMRRASTVSGRTLYTIGLYCSLDKHVERMASRQSHWDATKQREVAQWIRDRIVVVRQIHDKAHWICTETDATQDFLRNLQRALSNQSISSRKGVKVL